MTIEYSSLPRRRGRGTAFYTGWVLSLLPSLFIIVMVIVMLTMHPEMIQESMGKYGYPARSANWILAAELISLGLYLFPPTAVLGAILLTGYLGGAVSTHVRASEPPIMPIVFAIIFWLGLFLREPRLRALVFWRSMRRLD